MIAGGGLGDVHPDDVEPMSVQEPNGNVDVVAADEAEAVAVTKQLLGYFQGSTATWTEPDQSTLRCPSGTAGPTTSHRSARPSRTRRRTRRHASCSCVTRSGCLSSHSSTARATWPRPAAEAESQARRASRMLVAGAAIRVPLIAVVLRRGYGLGAQAMAGGSLHEPVLTVAWPGAHLGPMGFEGAVRLGLRKSWTRSPTRTNVRSVFVRRRRRRRRTRRR